MADTGTLSTKLFVSNIERAVNPEPGFINRYELTWGADSNGALQATTSWAIVGPIVSIQGDVCSAAPANNQSLTVKDSLGSTILEITNLSNTAATVPVCPGITITDGTTPASFLRTVSEPLSLTGANLTANNTGKLIITTRP